jgi:hypothetical protein
MKISFLDFWNGFQPSNNFLFYLFREVHQNLTIVEPSKSELIVFSVFGNENQKYSHCKKLFFTGENKRPDFTKCDFSISFDFDEYGGRNIRIPLWYYYIDWFKVGSYGDPNYLIPVEYLYDPNEFSEKEKKQFCSAVYSNPVGIRNQFVNLLSQYKRVDCYGKIGGFTRLPDGEKQKLDTISNYKFNICFENSIYPGYYTEKLLHAKVAGCVPVYFSDEKISEDFNQNSFLNLSLFENTEEMIQKIIELNEDDKKIKLIKAESFLTEKINLSSIYKKIKLFL